MSTINARYAQNLLSFCILFLDQNKCLSSKLLGRAIDMKLLQLSFAQSQRIQ